MISNKLSSKRVLSSVILLVAIVACAILYFSLPKRSSKIAPQTNNQSANSAAFSPDQSAASDNSTSIQQKPEKLIPAKNVPPTPKPTQEELDKINTSNWKIYTNTNYGYEIKYPSDWSIITREDYQVHFLAPETSKFDSSAPGWGDVYIAMQKSGPSDAPDQYSTKTSITLGKDSGNLYVGVNCGQDPEHPNISCTIADLTKDSREITINYLNELEKKNGAKYIGVYYKMLDTFRFSE